MIVYVVEAESGSSGCESCMYFDSVFSTREAAEEYIKSRSGWFFEITETELKG